MRPTNPFTGIGAPPAGPVIAVKIDDTFNGRPQLGIDQADIVYVEQVEAGLTRLLAIFASKRPVVEPVRSVRASDPELLTQYGSIVVAASGGAGDSLQAVSHSIIHGVYNGGPGFARDFGRSVPYNLTLNTSVLAAAFRTAGKAKSIGFTWSATVPSGASTRSGRSFRTTIGGANTAPVGFDYDPASKRYVRVIDGARQTAADGAAISTPNVIIQYCDVSVNPGDVDVVGNVSKYTHSVGHGPVAVFRDGREIVGTWSRPTSAAGTTLRTAQGKPISLKPGGDMDLAGGEGHTAVSALTAWPARPSASATDGPERRRSVRKLGRMSEQDHTERAVGAHLVGTARVKRGMAEMLKGGVIMDVVTPEQAKIAEDAGAVAVMALERVPADIRAQGGVSRMSDPDMIDGIISAVSIPVMAKARIGHFVEAQVLQALGVDYVDESEVLTPADYANHIDKWAFTVPFVCGATNLGEALRRITEGAAMIRSKGEAGTGDVSNAVTHMRQIRSEIRRLTALPEDELYRRRQAVAGALRARRRGGPGRQAAGRAVHRRWHRHARRRGDDDAARRGGRLRRLGHLQVRQPRASRGGDRQGDDLL